MESEVATVTFPATSFEDTLTPPLNDDIPMSTYVIAVSVATAMFLVTVVPNVMIIILVIVDRKLRKLSNYYIISLAVADCIVGAVVMPCMASYTILGYWALGGILCDIWITFDFMCCTASMLSLCMISLDRYWAITQPLKHMGRNSRKRAMLFVIAVWLVSLICWVPAIIIYRIADGEFAEYDCIYLTDPLYVLFSSIFIYYTPMIAMIVLYAKVYITVRKQSQSLQTFEDSKEDGTKTVDHAKRNCHSNTSDMSILSTEPSTSQLPVYINRGFLDLTQESSMQNETMTSDDVDPDDTVPPSVGNTSTMATEGQTLNSISLTVTQDQGHVVSAGQMRSIRLRQIRLKQAAVNRRTARTLGIIVIIFLVCWLPFVVLFPVNAFCDCVPAKIYDASYWLAYLNSALNPFLYGFSRDFRRAFKRHFCKRCMTTPPSEFSSVVDTK